MDARTLRNILNSDFKLWEQAHTAEDGAVITKSLDLPYGIGVLQQSFEGVNNAEGRRNAAVIWGEIVREAVDDAIGEESVSARAAQASSRVSPDDGGDGGPSIPNPYYAGEEALFAEGPVQTLGEATEGSATAGSRLNDLRRQRSEYARRIRGLDLEIKALQAYVEVIDEAKKDAQSAQAGETHGSEAFPDGEPEASEYRSGE